MCVLLLFSLVLVLKYCLDYRWRSWWVLPLLALNFYPQPKPEYAVQLDTGSSDLFIKGEKSPIPGSTATVRFHSPLTCKPILTNP